MNAQRQRSSQKRSGPKRAFKKPENGFAKDHAMTLPKSLPFIEALEKRFNKTIQKNNEQILLANYEKNWILKNTLGGITGKESSYVRYLAKKYNSFILNQI